MFLLFEFVDHSYGIIFDGDSTLAAFVDDQFILAQTKFPGTLTGRHIRRRTQEMAEPT